MSQVEQLADTLPESCKDLRLNLNSVLRQTSLTRTQTWAVALTSAYFLGCQPLADALIADGQEELTTNDKEDAQAAAALMGMNTVYYRFLHLVGKPSYEQLKPSLRMNRMMSPATSKVQFELCAMACAALAGCGKCILAHDKTLLAQEISETQIHDAVRVAAAVSGFVVALRLADQAASA